jgi:hypothetical protein
LGDDFGRNIEIFHSPSRLYIDRVNAAHLKATADAAVDRTREVLRRRRNVPYDKTDDFSIQTDAEAVQQFNDIIGGVALVVVVLSSIGLLIGGIGVMDTMLVSATERTREIGVRKAIAARSRDITWQFLFEAMTLTGTGGILGILVGSGIVLAGSGRKFPYSELGSYYRIRGSGEHGPDFWCLACHQGSAAKPCRSRALRVMTFRTP